MKIEKNCHCCAFYEVFDEFAGLIGDERSCGECRRLPPRIMAAEWVGTEGRETFQHRGLWPEVLGEEWCGKFKPAP